jgi:hypothetical protein
MQLRALCSSFCRLQSDPSGRGATDLAPGR